ncbi:MgtC/SapB family protein [Halobacillus halophilus]|uniref:MgtC/SapB family protein n=1 Tax=Halobacillus halophilus TaxID=1570 RepID=UPI001CD2FF60|nr:MgtC/SapB family protein [Halobacillus halophilus]MCA1012896.1 MgtC/SapB family protein [Halobacillus halophilus]
MEVGVFFDDDFLTFTIRIVIALILAGLIGFERELKNHSAGFRTHILVGVGSCLMMLLSLYGFESYMDEFENVRFDPARIPSYVISGIGFLGAGTIIVNGLTIRGLTTAASIWTVAGIGLVVGAGMHDVAILTTIIVLLSLVLLNKIEKENFNKKKPYIFQLKVRSDVKLQSITAIFDERELRIKGINIKKQEQDHNKLIIEIDKGQKYNRAELIEQLSSNEEVLQINHKF